MVMVPLVQLVMHVPGPDLKFDSSSYPPTPTLLLLCCSLLFVDDFNARDDFLWETIILLLTDTPILFNSFRPPLLCILYVMR